MCSMSARLFSFSPWRRQDTGPEMADYRWRRMLGEALPGTGLGGSQGTGEKVQGADAEGVAVEGGLVLKGTGDRAMAPQAAERKTIPTSDRTMSRAHKG